jgi:serine/threonine-protein kinase
MTQSTERLSSALADRYRILQRLGEGGMATVYLAEDLKHKRQVAVKVLKPELAAVLGAERFVQEITTTASLQHPHILPLFDSGEADSFLYYVMPFIDGETLRDKLNRETQLGIEEAVRITSEIADALDYAHRHDVIHRDIKPENILLHDGRPMVADFGIALAVSAAAGGRMTETGLSLGTPHYMSPEQATAEKEITARSDVYSLGSMLYEMLAGEPPHTGNSAQQIIMKIIAEEVAPVTSLRKSVPPNVAAAVAKSVERLPADRFATAADFVRALSDASFTTSVMGSGDDGGPGVSRRRPTTRVATAFLLGSAVATAGWLLGTGGSESEPVRRQRILLGSGPERLPELVAFRAAVHPGGDGVLFGDTVGTGSGSTVTAWWKATGSLEAVPITSLNDAITPTFSPDGQWVAFVQAGALKKQPLTGGNSVTLVDGVAGGTAHGLAWLDDGTIVFENTNFIIQRIHESGQGGIDTVSVEAQTGQPIHISGFPGGSAVLVSACVNSCPAGTMLSLVDLQDGTVFKLADGVVRAWPAPDDKVLYLTRQGDVFVAHLDTGSGRLGPPMPLFDGVRVSTDANGEMHVAPDGTALFVRGSVQTGSFRPVSVDRDGRAESVGSSPFPRRGYSSVALSPDGRKLALTIIDATGERLWVSDLSGGPLLPLTPNERNVARPVWHEEGTRLAYIAVDSSRQVHSVRADGTSPASDVVVAGLTPYEVAFSASGDTLLLRMFSTLGTGEADIVMLPPGVSEPQPLLRSTRFDESAIALSPDGRWLAFVSNVSGRDEVYIRPFPDVSAGQIGVSVDGGVEPVWARSGREIFYRDGTGWLVAAQLSGDGPLRVTDRVRLFDASAYAANAGWRGYDVMPGDQDFIMLMPGPGSAAEVGDLVMIENLFETLAVGAP